MRTLTRTSTGALITDSRTNAVWHYADYAAAEHELLFGSFCDELD